MPVGGFKAGPALESQGPGACVVTAISSSVTFKPNRILTGPVWALVATHALSGQEEHVVGFHTEAEAKEWLDSRGCAAWLRARGYVGRALAGFPCGGHLKTSRTPRGPPFPHCCLAGTPPATQYFDLRNEREPPTASWAELK